MCNYLRRWMAGIAVSWLLLVSSWAGWEAPLPPGMTPAFDIPKMTAPPKLDGVIDPVEWREAVAVSGVGGCMDNQLYARPTTFWLAWDDDHLYMAIRVWVRPGYKPAVSGRAPGAAGVGDDSAEFHFQPLGKNVLPGRTSSSYKFILNTLGFVGDLMRVSVGQQFKNWPPEFKTAVRLTPPASAPLGGSWWECEVAMSTKDFELTGPNRAGDQWKLMLGFNHMYSGWSQGRIPATTSYFDPGGFPLGTLVEKSPAVQMTMEDMPGLVDGGVAALRVTCFNPGPQAVQLDVTAQLLEVGKEAARGQPLTGAPELLNKTGALSIEPGKSAEFRVAEKLPRALGDNFGALRVQVMQGPRELFRYFVYVPGKCPPDALAPAQPEQRAFPLAGSFNPVTPSYQLTADSYYLPKPDDAQSVSYRILRAGVAKPVAEGVLDQPVTYFFRRLVALPPLEPGEYTVEAVMQMRDGRKLGPEKLTFTKLDEAKVFAAWWNTKLGNIERIIRPFVPMTRAQGEVTVWGRAYRLNGLGLPAAIVSQGKPVTAAGARIVASVAGRETVLSSAGTPEFTETKDWRVAFRGHADSADLAVTTSGWIEQDGLLQIELTYAPAGKAPVTLDALRLEFPLADDQADCLLCLGSGGNYSSRTTMLLPHDKDGVLWTTLDTGLNGAGMTVGSFYPAVWIGNEQRGLLWYADNDRGWVPDNAVPAHTVTRRNGQLLLTNNLIGKPFVLTGPRTVTFTLMASPFKPLVKGWRAAIYSEDGTFEGINKKRKDPKTGVEIDGWAWLTPPSRDPAEWSGLWAEYKKIADARVQRLQPFDPSEARNKYGSTVHTSLPLMGYDWKTPDEKVTGYFGADWAGDAWTKTEQDYFLYICDRAFREGGLRTIYWDIFFIARFDSLQNGVAYELPDGRIQPGHNALNIRRFMMRMYSLMQDCGLTPGSQVSHATNCYCLPACGWMDAILDGEYHGITDASGMDWVDGYPIERMRAMSVSGQFGPQISWMNLMSLQNPEKRALANRGFVEYPRLYDTWKTPSARMPEAALDWGLNDENVTYIPFWRNTLVFTADPDILVSMWQLPDRILLCVFNYNRQQQKDAVLAIDLDKLGLVPQLPWQEFVGVRDIEKGEKEPATVFDFQRRLLTVPALLPHTGRLVGVRRY